MQTPIDLRLARHGVIVLLLGLLTGFVVAHFHNPPLGNAAHLVGLIGGFGIIGLGLLWPRLNLGRSWSGAGAWMIAVSIYLNWLGCVFQGAFGSGPNATNSAMLGSPLLWDRTGRVALGEASVAIAVGSPHRGAAFDACEFAINTLKAKAPIWKRETYRDGDTAWIANTPP